MKVFKKLFLGYLRKFRRKGKIFPVLKKQKLNQIVHTTANYVNRRILFRIYNRLFNTEWCFIRANCTVFFEVLYPGQSVEYNSED